MLVESEMLREKKVIRFVKKGTSLGDDFAKTGDEKGKKGDFSKVGLISQTPFFCNFKAFLHNSSLV